MALSIRSGVMRWYFVIGALLLFGTAFPQRGPGYYDLKGRERAPVDYEVVILAGELTCIGCVNHILELAKAQRIRMRNVVIVIEIPNLFPDQFLRHASLWKSQPWFDNRIHVLSFHGDSTEMFSYERLRCSSGGLPHGCVRVKDDWHCKCCQQLFPENGSDEELLELFSRQ